MFTGCFDPLGVKIARRYFLTFSIHAQIPHQACKINNKSSVIDFTLSRLLHMIGLKPTYMMNQVSFQAKIILEQM